MKLLVCGTRKNFVDYKMLVFTHLAIMCNSETELIEGCCKGSADEFAEEFAQEYGLKIHHFPSTQYNYLKRNIEMAQMCDEVICFWDNFSYGSSHTVATAVRLGKPVKVVDVSRGGFSG